MPDTTDPTAWAFWLGSETSNAVKRGGRRTRGKKTPFVSASRIIREAVSIKRDIGIDELQSILLQRGKTVRLSTIQQTRSVFLAALRHAATKAH